MQNSFLFTLLFTYIVKCILVYVITITSNERIDVTLNFFQMGFKVILKRILKMQTQAYKKNADSCFTVLTKKR